MTDYRPGTHVTATLRNAHLDVLPRRVSALRTIAGWHQVTIETGEYVAFDSSQVLTDVEVQWEPPRPPLVLPVEPTQSIRWAVLTFTTIDEGQSWPVFIERRLAGWFTETANKCGPTWDDVLEELTDRDDIGRVTLEAMGPA